MPRQPLAEIMPVLRSLRALTGDTADADRIAATLTRGGYVRARYDLMYNPIAIYLRRTTRAQVPRVHHTYVKYRIAGGGWRTLPLSVGMHRFLIDFDAGHYPELVYYGANGVTPDLPWICRGC